jgi:hypothetical protein
MPIPESSDSLFLGMQMPDTMINTVAIGGTVYNVDDIPMTSGVKKATPSSK